MFLRRERRAPHAHSANHGVDAVAVALRVVEAFEDNGHGSFAGDFSFAECGFGEAGAEVAGEFHAAGEREVEFAALQGAHGDFQRAQAARVFAAHGVALAADAELLGDAAGVGAGERAHRAVGVERRAGGFDDAGGPRGLVLFGNVGGQAVRPVAGAIEHGPAEVEVGRAEVEAEADEDAGARGVRLGHSGVGEGVAGDFEHEGLLGKKLGEFARRDAVAADGNGEIVNKVAGLCGEGVGMKAAPVGTGGGLRASVGTEDVGGEGTEIFPRADVCAEADDGDAGWGMTDGVWRLERSGRSAGPLLDEHVGVDAAEAEAVDGGATRSAIGATRPGLALRECAEGALGERDFVAGTLEVGDGRERVVAE